MVHEDFEFSDLFSWSENRNDALVFGLSRHILRLHRASKSDAEEEQERAYAALEGQDKERSVCGTAFFVLLTCCT